MRLFRFMLTILLADMASKTKGSVLLTSKPGKEAHILWVSGPFHIEIVALV